MDKTSILLDENREFMRRIQKSKVVGALKKMKLKKVVGPDGIPIEVWRYLGTIGVSWLTNLFNKFCRTKHAQ